MDSGIFREGPTRSLAHASVEGLRALCPDGRDPLYAQLFPVLALPTGESSAGFPFLCKEGWDLLRDRVPYLFGMGGRVLALLGEIQSCAGALPEAQAAHLQRACKVVRQVVSTAAITAPPDLWLLRHVLGYFAQLGLLRPLLDGEALQPGTTCAMSGGERVTLCAEELDTDLHFLLARGVVEQYDDTFRIAGHPRVRELLRHVRALAARQESVPHPTSAWRALFAGEAVDEGQMDMLFELCRGVRPREEIKQDHWIPTLDEVELGYRLVPVVLGLRASGLTAEMAPGRSLRPTEWSESHPALAACVMELLTCAGWLRRAGDRYQVTELGGRGFSRGAGPFGIIETYHPYMCSGARILLQGRGQVWVRRGENVGASQDANRATFERANGVLDRFCGDTGFRYSVFIEHAIGRGEASRQRFARPPEGPLRFVGADLEDDAIEAAIGEQKKGRLPSDMLFVRNADIGDPGILLDALRGAGIDSRGAVMLVGNGFHEVRSQTDAGMVEVFRGYHDAGVLLIFTEESALSVDDLRATAFNTYHAGFKFVHEKSGQGLRPAEPAPRPSRLGHPLRAAWSECARQAGYVRADAYCKRSRTIYPYTPASGHNPSVSVNHFFVPGSIAARLGL